MSDPTPDAGWIQWAFGGLATAGILVASAGAGVAQWLSGGIDKVRKDGESERDALWERLNEHLREDEKIHREAERYFASKDDIKELKERISESEARILDAISGRSR